MYIKFTPNDYVLRYRKGKLVAEGPGLSFFYMERNTSVSSVPISAIDMDFIFEEMTQDYQTVSVQGQIACKFTDYRVAVGALDFSVDLRTGKYIEPPVPKLTKRMVNIVRVLVKNRLNAMALTEALQASRTLAETVMKDLQGNPECKVMGLEVCGFSILQIRANPETARALEAKTREDILKKSDDALYQRRNASIEQERRVKENELNTAISVEEKQKAIKQAELNTKRMVLAGDTELVRMQTLSKTEQEQIKLDAEIELERKRQELAELRLSNAQKDADAEAYRISAVMEAYNKLSTEVLVALATLNMDPERMIAQAFNNLATNTEKIGTLNITPDLLESLKVRDRK